MDLKKNLVKVFSADFIGFIVGIINSFLIPAFLGLEQYSYLKTYALYLSYVGILHFGFIDGIHIKYGGKTKDKLRISLLKYEHNFILQFQILVTVGFLIVACFLKNFVLMAFALSIVPINMRTFFSFLYQAIGELSLYVRLRIIPPMLNLIFSLSIIFLLKINSYIPFVLANLTVSYVLYTMFELQYIQTMNISGVSVEKDFKEIKKLFISGAFVMLGNLSTILVYSLDRWFVKFLLTTQDFAYYSFAISMMSILNMLISSVALTFYPYLARGYSEEQIRSIKKYMIIIGSLGSFGYFILGFLVNTFLRKYVPSLNVIAILFAGYPAVAVINALYVNLYKVNKQEKKYFWTVFSMVIISFTFNLMAVIINKNNQTIAFATTISFFVWFFYSSKDFKGLETSKEEIMFIVLYLPTFLFSTLCLDLAIGAIFFGVGISLLIFGFYRKEFLELTKKILSK